MSWYTRFLTAASQYNCVIRPDISGKNFCYITGPCWNISQQLNQAGFKFDRNAKQWSRDAASFQQDVSSQKMLETLGVPIPVFPVSGVNTQQNGQQPQQPPKQKNPLQNGDESKTTKNWVLATVINLPPMSPGDPVVITTNKATVQWDWMSRDQQHGTVSPEQVKQCVQSYRDSMGKLLQSSNPQQLFDAFDTMQVGQETEDKQPNEQQSENKPLLSEDVEKRKKGIIAEHNITPEQQGITKDFGTGQNIATAALAGTGKTTQIFHLACTYGRDGEDWQYLVFNTKNKVEAKQKAKKYGIDGFFRADSTNGYLGKVIESPENAGRIPTTKRMVSIEKKPKRPIPSKVALLLDGDEVKKAMAERYKMVNPETDPRIRALQQQDKYVYSAINGIVKSIRYEFKNASKTLCGLGKAYAIDPRLGADYLRKEILKIADAHDIDFELSRVKERIGNYDSRMRTAVLSNLKNILGYDIMQKSLKQEIIETAEFLLQMSMPRASKQVYTHTTKAGVQQKHVLGEMRDFDDDLWYSAINANKLTWPKKKVVMADEAQDFNRCQIIALQKLAQAGAQVMIVGDKNQCVIEGTRIKQNGADVPIESIKVGQKVDTGHGGGITSSNIVTDVFVKYVTDSPIIRIKTKSGKEISSTPEHTHFCGYTKKSPQLHFVYLMHKDGLGYRIGITRSRRAFYKFGDKLWLLGSFATEKEARYYEQFYAIKYSIPTWRFVADGVLYEQNDINTLFGSLDTASAAMKLLTDKHMFINQPHIVPKCMNRKRYRNFNITMCGDPRNQSMHRYSLAGSDEPPVLNENFSTIRKTKRGWRCENVKSQLSDVYELAQYAAKNLNANIIEKARLSTETLPYCPASHALPGMSIFIYDNGKIITDEIESVSIIKYTGNVYDLNVDRVHNFIANNVVTHNSMYRFRGADDNALNEMGKLLGTQKMHTLSLNFRQRPALINFSNEHSCVKDLKRGLRLSDKDMQDFFTRLDMPGCPEYLAEVRQKFPGTENGVDTKKLQAACNAGQQEWPPTANGVVTFKEMDRDGALNSIKNQKAKTGKVRQTAILSPTNRELVPAALELLQDGIPFVITGSDLADQLVNHTKEIASRWVKDPVTGKNRKTDNDPNMPIGEFLDRLLRHRDTEVDKHGNKAAKADEIKTLNTVTGALETCVHMFDANLGGQQNALPPDIDPNNADEMEQYKSNQQPVNTGPTASLGGFQKWLTSKLGGLDIENNEDDAETYAKMMENEDNCPVTLSTVHRSKGLEFSDVFILNYNGLINPPNVTRQEDIEQWKHAHYVALTRAKNAQHIIDEDD